MKEEKKEQIKELLEEAKKKVEQMKDEMPEESLKQSEAMLEQISSLLEGKFSNKMIGMLIVKYILSFFLLFILGFLLSSVILGYSASLINPIPLPQFFIVVPVLSGIFVVLLRLLTLLTNTLNVNPLMFILLFSFLTISAFTIIDSFWVHIGINLDASLFLITILWFGFIGVDLWLQKKIFL